MDTVRQFAEVMSMLDEDWKDDTRLVQQTKDFCKNGLLLQQLLLTDGEPTPTLYIADVARELDIKLQPGDTSVIGKRIIISNSYTRENTRPSPSSTCSSLTAPSAR